MEETKKIIFFNNLLKGLMDYLIESFPDDKNIIIKKWVWGLTFFFISYTIQITMLMNKNHQVKRLK